MLGLTSYCNHLVPYDTEHSMNKPVASIPRRRSLVSFSDSQIDQLLKEATRRGLRLATYIRTLVLTHPERARGAGTR
jgi:hypothetical protein